MRALVLVTLLLLAAWVPRSLAASRLRRYLHFPYGSTYRVAFVSKWGTLFDPAFQPGLWTEAVNWGINFDLPNGTQYLGPAGLQGRRDRRDLYRRLETALDSTGYLGRSCLLRAICEAPQALSPGDNVFAEAIRTILWSPPSRNSGHSDYDSAQHFGSRGYDCGALYRDCPVSLLDYLLSLR